MEILSHKPRVAQEDKLHTSPSQAQAIIDEPESSFTRELHITDLARSFYISPNYLCTHIKRETGMIYSDFIITKRIQLAKRLLRETDLSIQEIIDQIGYKDYAHFCKLFKRREGITPT